MSNLKEHIKDERKVLNSAVSNYRWLKKMNRRFWLLEHIFKNRTIEVSNWESFEPDPENKYDGRPDGVDVDISLPPLPTDIYYCAKSYLGWIKEFKSLPDTKCYVPWFSERWVFEIHNIESFYSVPVEDAYYILCDCKPSYKNSVIPPFYQIEKCWDLWIRDNLPKILLSGPIVTFDVVWTKEKSLKKEHVVQYTEHWLEKWYPNLSKRKIEYMEKQ